MSDWDDWDYGADIEAEREADYQHELAIAQHMDDRERDEDDRRRFGRS